MGLTQRLCWTDPEPACNLVPAFPTNFQFNLTLPSIIFELPAMQLREDGWIQIISFALGAIIKAIFNVFPVISPGALERTYKSDAYGHELQQAAADDIANMWFVLGGLYMVLSFFRVLRTFDTTTEDSGVFGLSSLCEPCMDHAECVGYCRVVDAVRPTVCFSFTDSCLIPGCEVFIGPNTTAAATTTVNEDANTNTYTNTHMPEWAEGSESASWSGGDGRRRQQEASERPYCDYHPRYPEPFDSKPGCLASYWETQLMAPAALLIFDWFCVGPLLYVLLRCVSTLHPPA